MKLVIYLDSQSPDYPVAYALSSLEDFIKEVKATIKANDEEEGRYPETLTRQDEFVDLVASFYRS